MAATRAQPPAADRVGAGRGTLMHLVERCEGTLGWQPQGDPRGLARRRAFGIEVAKLKRAIAKDPVLLTIHNLELSLEWCWHKRLRIVSPLVLIYHVEDALKLANAPEVVVDIIAERDNAIEYEKHHADADSDRWLRRLGRAQGAGLVSTIDDWKHARVR